MKYLSDYLKEEQNKLLEECKCFFAFNNKQYKKGVEKYPNVGKWVHVRNVGMFVPKENAEIFLERHSKLVEEAIKQDVAENGKKGVIHRELGNHEYSYTFCIDQTVDALQDYGITVDEIRAETGPYLKAFREWEEAENLKAQKV